MEQEKISCWVLLKFFFSIRKQLKKENENKETMKKKEKQNFNSVGVLGFLEKALRQLS